MTTISDAPRQLFLDGEWVAGHGDEFPAINPSSGDTITRLQSADAADVDRAVGAARAALRGAWAATPPSGKGVLLFRLADLVERDQDVLAALEASDMGAPITVARMLFVPNLISTLRYYAGWADKINGESIANDGSMGRPLHSYSRREPIGVIAAIVPWNSPLMILGWKLGPALATGNTMIVKPAEDASLAILHLASLVAEAGFPPGVVQILTGPGSVTGEALVTHPGVDKVSFTGSTAVGQRILRHSADTMTRTTLELGGKAPQIVFEDCDLAAATQGVAMGIFVNQGQSCAAGSRILVHRSIVDDVLDGMQSAARSLMLGDPLDPATTMGPLISARQRERVMGYVQKGRAEGARLVTGGETVDPGFYVQPTVFVGTNDLTIAREEIFGPVATVVPFDDEDSAIELANDTRYGLSASVWTRDVGRAHAVSNRLQAGAVGVNCWSPLAPQLPWGGLKSSGIGRELGYDGILADTELKTVSVLL
ncbi:aldehyde dehydrogenase family protein [Rhodococcus sp. USK13]|uniref:aldehyde dehydrogenase family protein n=1 Tax=Rhodococcus sp. USK13 TaxID=2806442 RepID=UPI001BD02DB6|nr:aldehyde dehydrogenase family protein [Rhodococcus sp. USK13]